MHILSSIFSLPVLAATSPYPGSACCCWWDDEADLELWDQCLMIHAVEQESSSQDFHGKCNDAPFLRVVCKTETNTCSRLNAKLSCQLNIASICQNDEPRNTLQPSLCIDPWICNKYLICLHYIL